MNVNLLLRYDLYPVLRSKRGYRFIVGTGHCPVRSFSNQQTQDALNMSHSIIHFPQKILAKYILRAKLWKRGQTKMLLFWGDENEMCFIWRKI
jgi:hypothetical protein